MEWTAVTSKKQKKQQKKKANQQQQHQRPQQQQQQQQQRKANSDNAISKKTENRTNPVPKRRRPPRTAAVAIKGVAEGFSYSAALKKLRDGIKLPELEIEKTTIRHAVSGGLLIEVPGKDKATKAELLREKVCSILGDEAKVTRPVIKGDVRLIGIDDSVGTDEVADVIATAGGCKPSEVKVGVIRPMTNGLFTVWAQCPLGAANKASSSGKIKIGWTVARIEILKARPTQCFKCWGHGHLRVKCTSTVDRSRTCYRCGAEGHPALTCTNPVRCILCAEQGKDSNHRIGTRMCKADFRATTGAARPQPPQEAMDTEDAGRRPEETLETNVQSPAVQPGA
ncbi:uncharacterized protein LOC114944330 [Nylanderia fulva]|uniref:uncharacterized protein LOC114944330 n=1 Tax=Nylanderia fulva TaxID=613905 RepID=UPI0010FAE2C6|nr:uncharacterized protein LOC114944330 [Nylanderia fulva]